MNQYVIGLFGRIAGAISLARPIDHAKYATGEVRTKNKILYGRNTKFLSELNPGSTIESKGLETIIISVISDIEATCSENLFEDYNPFKLIPKLDNSKAFEVALDRLEEGHCVAICPEGRTHETPGLMKFKSGAGILIRTALEKDIPVKVYFVGANYSNVERLRDNATLCISKEIIFEKNILNGDTRQSAKKIMQKIEEHANELVIPLNDYNEVKFVYYTSKVFYPESESRINK